MAEEDKKFSPEARVLGSGAMENKWKFSAEKYDKLESLEEHATLLSEKMTALPWWKDDLTVLDFGCGTCSLAAKLVTSKKTSRVEAVDVESEMVEYAKKKVEKLGLQESIKVSHLFALDASELVTFAEVDCLYAITVLGHIRDLDLITVFKNFAKVLKSGTRLVIADFDDVENIHGHNHGEDDNEESGHISDGGHVHTRINEDILTALCAVNGLDVETVEEYELDLFNDGNKTPMIFFVAVKL